MYRALWCEVEACPRGMPVSGTWCLLTRKENVMAQELGTQPTVEELLSRIETLEARLGRKRRILRGFIGSRFAALAAAGVLALGAGGMAFASLPHAAGVIHGCKGK